MRLQGGSYALDGGGNKGVLMVVVAICAIFIMQGGSSVEKNLKDFEALL